MKDYNDVIFFTITNTFGVVRRARGKYESLYFRKLWPTLEQAVEYRNQLRRNGWQELIEAAA